MIYRSHRGGVYYTPENTIPAFEDAIVSGFDIIETDPCFTKDGILVLHHDNTINRTCRNADGSEISEPVLLSELTYQELMQYDAGIHMGEKFRGQKVPTLEELLVLVEGTNVALDLDKKCPNDRLKSMTDLVKKYTTKVYFSCGDTARIRAVLTLLPDAYINYDGPATEDALKEVVQLVSKDRLIVWMYMDKPNFWWLDDTRKASLKKCALVKKYAQLGIANINNPYDMREALSFSPDIIEV